MSRASVRWSGLLVSVRDAAEAAEAVAGGAAIVDVKEPLRGPLGEAPPAAVAAVAAVVAGRRPWTLACGELAGGGAACAAHVAAAIAALPAGIARPAAAKAGPAGLSPVEWRREFAAFTAALARDVEPVAVAYADWRAAGAPEPSCLVAAAAGAGCRALLIDTFDKAGAGLLESPGAAGLPVWIVQARAAGMTVAVAGRLSLPDLPRAAALDADVVAVRSAACRGGRSGRVERGLVAAALAATLSGGGAVSRAAIPECTVP